MEVKELEQNMQLSPLLTIAPTVISYTKRVEIKIVDTLLLPNTTYKIALGNALVDNREATPYKDFTYIFSTGSYFDSLELHGDVLDAETGKPDTAALIMLYTELDIDSAVVKKKPLYAVKADASGHFSFSYLPQKPFHIYAIQDVNNNYIYDYGEEKIGFLNQMVVPAINTDTLHHFQLFKEERDTLVTSGQEDSAKTLKESKSSRLASRAAPKNTKNELGYKVNVDTLNRHMRTFELTHPLTIDLSTIINSLDTAKVYLSYENEGIEVESIQKVTADSSHIKLTTQWIGNKIYTLRLIKGWATDTAGKELAPGKYFFRTKQEEDYGTLKIHIPAPYAGDGYLLYVYRKNDSIYQKPIKDSIITLSLLQPGTYGMRIITDQNKNGKWDAGNFFAKRQPEIVIPHFEDITLKAGWEHEVDFRPITKKQDKKPHKGTNGRSRDAEQPKQEKEEKK